MRNLLVTIAYKGSAYHGFQVQKNALSVCQVFQNAALQILAHRPDIKGCSRTDAGVHANMYCLSFLTHSLIPCQKLAAALNAILPHDISVTNIIPVDLSFHARYNCKGKEYIYRILNSSTKDPFSPELSFRYSHFLDADMLHTQAQDFLGSHDFSAFSSAHSNVSNTLRHIFSFQVLRHGDFVIFTVHGDGFLYNMVRIMVGTLIFIASGKIHPGSIPSIIASHDRSLAGKTMPPQGLFLNKVFY